MYNGEKIQAPTLKQNHMFCCYEHDTIVLENTTQGS